ncbi:MAG: L-rhamnose mutarotase [Clostridia bacterium]
MAVVKSGVVIGVKPGMLDEYIALHKNQPPEIRALMKAHGFKKCEIFVHTLPNGETLLFQYNEVEGDTSALYENEAYRQWLRITGNCQKPCVGQEFWLEMENVYRLSEDR